MQIAKKKKKKSSMVVHEVSPRDQRRATRNSIDDLMSSKEQREA